MKSRKEVARFIEEQLDFDSGYGTERYKDDRWHYGFQELRDLLDYVYEGVPKNQEEELHNKEGKYMRL